jgi:peptide chain release factor 2
VSCPRAPTRSRPEQSTCWATFDLDTKRVRLAELDAEINDPSLWDDPRHAATLTQDASRLREEITSVAAIEKRTDDALDLASMLDSEPDDEMGAEVSSELDSLERELDRRELELLYSDPYSDNPAIVGIHAGAGGTDSQDWAEMLMRMYMRWAEEKKYSVEFIDESPGDEAGIKSATLRITGPRAFGLLKSERGVHRLVRISPFDAAARRHTSFALVEVTPEIEDAVDIDIDPKDVREDVYRSSGAGGQHVNKTSSAIRLTHIPTGVVVTCQNERSQHQNRDVAWRVLRSRLLALKQAAHAEHVAELRGESMPAEWGSQIRSYVLHPYTMVKDHRTGAEVGNAQSVLDGNLDPFMEAYLRWSAREAA